MTPQRIQLRRVKGWRKPEGAVVVARPTKWGNPWRITLETNAEMPFGRGAVIHHDRTGAILGHVRADSARHWATQAYRRDLSEELTKAARVELRGRDLCCWCPIGSPCHADVLLKIANA